MNLGQFIGSLSGAFSAAERQRGRAVRRARPEALGEVRVHRSVMKEDFNFAEGSMASAEKLARLLSSAERGGE